jgi:hypothetical protein
MATFVFGPNQGIRIASTASGITAATADMSDHVSSVTLDLTRDTPEVTALGDGDRRYIGGLRAGSGTIEAFNDYAANEIFAVVDACFRQSTVGFMRLALNDATINASAVNPFFDLEVWFTSMPQGGSVGDAATISIPFTVNGPSDTYRPRGASADIVVRQVSAAFDQAWR